MTVACERQQHSMKTVNIPVMIRPQRKQKKAHCQNQILLACDQYHLNAELMTRVRAEHLAFSRGARKNILGMDNSPESHNISSKGTVMLLLEVHPRGMNLVQFTHEVKTKISSENEGMTLRRRSDVLSLSASRPKSRYHLSFFQAHNTGRATRNSA